MEQKLREALDRASFECAVVRIENGIYSFGPNVCAIVELTQENEVVACQQGTAEWIPVDEFIRCSAQRPQLSATGSKASPVDNTVSSVSSSSDMQGDRRQFGPPAKPGQPPYPTGSPPPVPTPVTVSSAHAAVSSTSPRRVAPVVQGGTTSSHPSAAPAVTMGRQAAGSTPERVRMPGQPSPPLPYSAANAASAPQSGGQRVLVAPGGSGGGLRYGVTALSPGRQMPSSASPVYQQGASSPRPLA